MSASSVGKVATADRSDIGQIPSVEADGCQGDYCGETALYPMSPISMSLYYAFLPEFEIE